MEQTEFTQLVGEALHRWHAPTDGSPFESLSLFQELRRASPHARVHSLVNRILDEGLSELGRRNAQAAELLRKRFFDELLRKDVARDLSISISHLDRLQRDAIVQLAQAILDLDGRVRFEPAQRTRRQAQQLRYRLDLIATYDRLFGVEELLATLTTHLLHPGPPFVLAVEGIGGIGKTSLVIECLRSIIERDDFARFAFVTAQQQQLLASGDHRLLDGAPFTPDAIISAIGEQLLSPDEAPTPATTQRLLQRMQQTLQHERGLIVVDNLETIQALDSLLPALHTLANPSKVLVTTRQQPPVIQPIHCLALPELMRPAALQLLRHHAVAANVAQLVAAPDAEFERIFALAGGNPLALRLIVGQCHAHPLTVVLDDLLQARSQAVDQLYTFIYRRAWDHLAEAARQLLVAMLLIPPHGANLATVNLVAGLDATAVGDSLTQLVRCNLVDYHPLAGEGGVYSLHSLTRTFLHRQVLRWM